MKTSIIAATAALATMGLAPLSAQAQQAVSDEFGVSFQMTVVEGVTFTIDGDLVIDEKSEFDTRGFQVGCIGLPIGPDFELSMSSANRPQGTNYFYLRGAGDSYLRYHLTLQSFTPDLETTYWGHPDKSGAPKLVTVPDAIMEKQDDQCGSDVTFRLKAAVWDDIHPTADPDAGAGQNVYQGSNALRVGLPTGDYLFNDTVTITLAPILG